MKKIFFTILLALAIAAGAYAADTRKAGSTETAASNKEFLQTREITGEYEMHEQKILDNVKKGENQLPVPGKRTFAKMFDGYSIKQAIQHKGTDGESFYISAENEKESIIVKIDDNLEVSIFRKPKVQ